QVKVTAAGTPINLNLTGTTNVSALRNIFETKLNGEMKFQILETGDATLVGKIKVGSLQTIASAEIGGSLAVAGSLSVAGDLAVAGKISTVGDLVVGGQTVLGNINLTGDLAVGGQVVLDSQRNLKNITSAKITASVNPDGTVTPGNIPATSVGSAVSIAQTSADPATATRATLALSTQGQTSYDYLIWSDLFNVSYDGRLTSRTLNAREGLTLGSTDLTTGTLLSAVVSDNYAGELVKFVKASGQNIFLVNADGQLEVDKVKIRALVIDNKDEPRATIGSAIIPVGMTQAIVSAPEVKPGMKIFLTPKLPLAQSLAITNIQDGNFTVSLVSGLETDLPFDWWLVDVTNPAFAASVTGSSAAPFDGGIAPSSEDIGDPPVEETDPPAEPVDQSTTAPATESASSPELPAAETTEPTPEATKESPASSTVVTEPVSTPTTAPTTQPPTEPVASVPTTPVPTASSAANSVTASTINP
ncbi:MAG: hypothetical protein ABIJ81_03935, partial [Patescibacteria group bacterium]